MRTSKKHQPIALEDIAAKTLRGDVRDFLLQWIRNLPKAWPQMAEAEQKNVVAAADKQADALVRHVTNLVGSQGFRSFEVSVGDFQKKGNRLEAKIAAIYSRENLIEMAEAGEAGPIVLSLVSLESFQAERAPAKVMPDQPDLMDGDEAGEQAAPSGEQQAGVDFNPETGEIIDVQPEDGQRLTYDPEGGEQADTEDGDREHGHARAGDDIAAEHQRAALSQAELDALSPEQRANVDRLAGIKALDADGDRIDGDGDQAQAAPSDERKKRRGRRTVDQRVADNARAAESGRML